MRRLTVRLTGAAAALGAATACASATGPVSDGTVRAAVTRDSLRLTNLGPDAVFATVIGVETAPLIDWYPCVDAARCRPPIAPGATHTEARPTTVQGRAEREATVYWWRAVAGAGGALRPDSVRSFRVRFP